MDKNEYVECLHELELAEREAKRVVSLVTRVAELLRDDLWKVSRFCHVGHSFPFSAFSDEAISPDDWPVCDDVAAAISKWQNAKHAVSIAYREMPKEIQQKFERPN